jgi:hypothetical protein
MSSQLTVGLNVGCLKGVKGALHPSLVHALPETNCAVN